MVSHRAFKTEFNGSQVRDLPELPADQAAREEFSAAADGERAAVSFRKPGSSFIRAEEAKIRLHSSDPQVARVEVVQT